MPVNTTTPKQTSTSKGMTIKEASEKAQSELKALTGFAVSSVVSVKHDGETWRVTVELLEKEGIPDRMDILGIYETNIDSSGNLTGYERKGLRKRGDTAGQEYEEVE
jgi:hypothetical protein